MLDFFVYRKHLCIAFELLSKSPSTKAIPRSVSTPRVLTSGVNLYEVLKQNSFRGVFSSQFWEGRLLTVSLADCFLWQGPWP